jgi:hypothetical protein
MTKVPLKEFLMKDKKLLIKLIDEGSKRLKVFKSIEFNIYKRDKYVASLKTMKVKTGEKSKLKQKTKNDAF